MEEDVTVIIFLVFVGLRLTFILSNKGDVLS